MAANVLREVGYTSLADMEGGMLAWEESSPRTADSPDLSLAYSVPDLACSSAAQPPASTINNLLPTSLRVLPATVGRVFAVSALLLVALSTVSRYRDLQAAAIMAPPPFPVLPPLEVNRLVEQQGYVYLDVRTAEEFAQVHVPGSDLIPYFITAPDGLSQRQEVKPGSVGDDCPGIHKARGSQGGYHRMGAEWAACGEAEQQA
ncbi:unnamed protein product [Closterium sp. Naga37s-1]|nr:unnamed protein product [Closterium sp. Naga37s-1]